MLANVNIATKLIVGMGGGNWVGDMVGKMTRKQDTKDAVAVYAPHFDDEDVVRASCRDYEAAALVDVPAQVEDQRMGKKVGIPMLVFWSQIGLGRWFDVAGSWGGWIAEDVDVEFVPVGEGAGHYIPEDASEFVGEWLLKWLEKVD